MGFGYLLFGYLVAHVLNLTVSGLGFGGVAVIVGAALMLLGLQELRRYQADFLWAEILLLPMLICALYSAAEALNLLFLWQLPIFDARVSGIFDILSFAATVLFNLAMLYGIRSIARSVELGSMVLSAVRNMCFVGVYAVLMLVGNLPIAIPEAIKGGLALFTVLLNIAWVICNLLLLLSCNKNICRKGDEEVTPKRSRFGFINRMQDTFERTRRETAESTRAYTEERLRKRREKRNKKH